MLLAHRRRGAFTGLAQLAVAGDRVAGLLLKTLARAFAGDIDEPRVPIILTFLAEGLAIGFAHQGVLARDGVAVSIRRLGAAGGGLGVDGQRLVPLVSCPEGGAFAVLMQLAVTGDGVAGLLAQTLAGAFAGELDEPRLLILLTLHAGGLAPTFAH